MGPLECGHDQYSAFGGGGLLKRAVSASWLSFPTLTFDWGRGSGERQAWLSPALRLAGCNLCQQQEILAAWPLLRQWLHASWQLQHGTEDRWQDRVSSGAAAPSVTMLSGWGLAYSGGIAGGSQIRARMLGKMVYVTQQLKLSCACDTHLQGPGYN